MLFVIYCDKCKKRFGVIDHTISKKLQTFSRMITCSSCQNIISIFYNQQELRTDDNNNSSSIYHSRKISNTFPNGPHLIYYDQKLEELIHKIDYGFSWVHIIDNYSERLKIFS